MRPLFWQEYIRFFFLDNRTTADIAGNKNVRIVSPCVGSNRCYADTFHFINVFFVVVFHSRIHQTRNQIIHDHTSYTTFLHYSPHVSVTSLLRKSHIHLWTLILEYQTTDVYHIHPFTHACQIHAHPSFYITGMSSDIVSIYVGLAMSENGQN